VKSTVDQDEHQVAFAGNFTTNRGRTTALSGASTHSPDLNGDDQVVTWDDLSPKPRSI
jgi:hypothetical protein